MDTQFKIIGKTLAASTWDGKPATLDQYGSVAMPQTPNGSAVLGFKNTDTQNSDGLLTITSGGFPPEPEDAPALANAPSIIVQNWGANNLTLTNTSAAASTTIFVELFGPGIPGVTPGDLKVGTAIEFDVGDTLQGKSTPNYMTVNMTANSGQLAIIALIGGPTDATGNNAYVFALNYAGSGTPPGYTKATGGNSLAWQIYFGSSTIFLANMSPETSSPVTINLVSL